MNTWSLSAAVTVGLAVCCGPIPGVAERRDSPRPAAASADRAAAYAPPAGSPSQQTRPTVSPLRGGRSTRFVLHLTTRQRLGVSGGLRSDYRVTVSRSDGSCAVAFTIARAAAGARLHEVLHAASRAGWCRGRYKGVVSLDRAPSCMPLPNGQAIACPQFVLAPVGVGRFSFTVT